MGMARLTMTPSLIGDTHPRESMVTWTVWVPFRGEAPSVGVWVLFAHDIVHQFDGDGKDDGGVLLGWDRTQGLQVSKLEGARGFVDDVLRLLQGSRRLLLTLRCNHLQTNEAHYNTYLKQIRIPVYSGWAMTCHLYTAKVGTIIHQQLHGVICKYLSRASIVSEGCMTAAIRVVTVHRWIITWSCELY